MPAGSWTTGELIHSDSRLTDLDVIRIILQDTYGRWLCIQVRWERKTCLMGSPLTIVSHSHIHCQLVSRPFKTFRDYGIFRLQLTGYKIFLGTMKGIRDMRHWGQISRDVERVCIHWRGNGCSVEKIQSNLLFRSPVSRNRPSLLSDQFSKISKVSRLNHYIWNLL